MKPFLTPRQIAEFEHVTPATAARWVRERIFLRARKVGKEYRVPIESYQVWREKTKIIPNVQTMERSDGRTNAHSQKPQGS